MSKKVRKVEISTPFITLNQLLKYTNLIEAGFLCKEYINSNKIELNSEIISQRGKKIYPGSLLKINDEIILEIVSKE